MGVGIGRAVLQAMLQVIISCFNITWWGNKVKKKKWLRGNLREEGEKQSMASSGVWPRGPLTPRAPLLLSRSVMSDSATSWTVAHQAPLSMGFSRQEYWSGLPFPSPGDLPDPGIKPRSPALQADSLPTELWGKPYEWDSVQSSSIAQLCQTLCEPMDCSMPGLPVHCQLPEFMQIHVHWVSDGIQPSHPLSSPSPPAFDLSQHQGLFKWVNSSLQVAQVLEFQLQHLSFQCIFRTDFL